MEQSSAQYWENASLPTHNGTQPARRFVHPKRHPGFPDMFLLPEPHPLRPAFFTPANHPQAGCNFRDYVLTVHKGETFMKQWNEAGSKTTTPSGDVSANEGNSMHLPTYLSTLPLHACNLGWLKLEEGDVVWVRDMDGTNNPTDDAIRFYYISQCACSQHLHLTATNLIIYNAVESLTWKTRPHSEHWQKRSWALLSSEPPTSPRTTMGDMKAGLHLSAPLVQRVSSSHDVIQLLIPTRLLQISDLHQSIQNILILMRTLPSGGK